MLNNRRRGTLGLTVRDAIFADYDIALIDSAIRKYYSAKPMTLYRGYTDPTRMYNFIKRDKRSGKIVYEKYNEESFTSCSEKYDVAEAYATLKHVKTPIVSVCTYPVNTPMLYLDEQELEWLLPPAQYQVNRFELKIMKDECGNFYNGVLYYTSLNRIF